MKAVEIGGFIDDKGLLTLDQPLKVQNARVKVIVLIEENSEISDEAWLKSIKNNDVFDFLYEENEDIYTLNDGKPTQYEI